MQKRTIIKKIKEILNNDGLTTTADMELSSSPVHKSIGKDNHALIERFGQNKATVVVYVHETEVDEYDIDYEEIDKNTLEDLLTHLENYEVDQEKTLKRCEN